MMRHRRPTVPSPELQYLMLLDELLDIEPGVGRNGQTRAVVGRSISFDAAPYFDANGVRKLLCLTSKFVWHRGAFEEMCWMIRGETDNQVLKDAGVHIWDAFEPEDTTDLGPIYGSQWRNFNGVDQLRDAIQTLRDVARGEKHCRRLVISAWNPPEINDMALPPCHYAFEFHTTDTGRTRDDGTPIRRLGIVVHQRSADIFLGVPFNLVNYSMLLHAVSALTGLEPGMHFHTFGNLHLYENHVEQAQRQLKQSESHVAPLPYLAIDPALSPQADLDHVLDNMSIDWFTVRSYRPGKRIKAPVSV